MDEDEQQHHHVAEPILQGRRNPQRNRHPPQCGTGHRLGHHHVSE